MGKNNRQRRANKKRTKLKKLREHKNNGLNRNIESLGPVIQDIGNPFSGLSDDERRQTIQDLDINSAKIYRESLTTIMGLLHRYDPISLLSTIATHGLMVNAGDDGIQKKDSDFEIYQCHIEICQGLMLQIKQEELQKQPFGPDVVQELCDALIKLMQAHGYRGIVWVLEGESESNSAVGLLQESMRSNTQMVRNWGYFSQVKVISQEIYGYFDVLLESVYGFSASNVINLFLLLLDEIETSNSNRIKSLSNLHKLKDKNELVLKYYEMIGITSVDADQFMKEMDVDALSLSTLFGMIISHYDLRLHENYEFSPKYLAGNLGVDEFIVTKILDEFSFKWGDLESYETGHLFLSNPIWSRQLLKINNEKYFCVLPQAFFSFVFPSLNRLVNNADQNLLSDRRADYLEKKIIEIISSRFPESNIVTGVKWQINNTEYETDLITFIDSYAFIVEVKSGGISEPALRGAPDRLKKHIEEILIAPNIQSKRFKERLEELIANPNIKDELRGKLPVDLGSIHKIIRVSVSLEDFGSIQSNIAQLRETGWLPSGFEACPTMNLADFDTLFDFLEHPVHIIHYLERRQELEEEMGYMGDELDLMGLYIGTLFNFGDIDSDVNFIISEMSSPIDAYYNSKDAGIDIPKPKPKISPLFAGVLDQLEQRNTPRWTEIGVILNRFSPDDQRKIAKLIERIKKNVRKNWRIEGHKNIVICSPPKASEYAFCYVLYNNNNVGRKNEFIHEAARLGLDAKHVKQCLIIAKNMDKNGFNYDFIGLME